MSTGGAIDLGKLTLDASGITNTAKQVDAQIVKLAKSIERTMQGGSAQAQRLTRAMGQLGGQMLNATRGVTQAVNQMTAGNQTLAAGIQQTNQSIQQLTQTVNQLAQQVQAGFQQMAQQQRATTAEAVRGESAWRRLADAGRHAGEALRRSLDPVREKAREASIAVGGLTAAVSAATVAGLKIGGDYEQSMARVKAVTQSTAAEYEKLDAYAKKLGIDTVYSAKDAAEGMAYLAQGGYKVNQIMGAMRPVMDLAATAQVGVGDASRILVNIMESMRLHVEDLPHAVDVLAKAMVSGGNDMMEFGEAFKYVGPVAKAAGVSLEETAATIQLLGKSGINASMGGTALRGMLSYLSMESPKLRKDFKSLGIEVYDAGGKLKALPDIIDQFNAALKDANRQGEATKLIMGDIGQRAGPGFLSLMQLGGDAIRKLSAEMTHSTGLANEIADIQISTVKNKFGQLVESITTLGINFTGRVSKQLQTAFQSMNDWLSDNANAVTDKLEMAWNTVVRFASSAAQSAMRVYQAWAPTLQSLWSETVQLYQAFTQWFDSLPPGVQDALKTAAALTGISLALTKVGGQIPILGEFARSVGALINPLGGVSAAIRALVPLLSAAGTGLIPLLGMLFSPVGLVVVGTVALTALVGYMTGDVAGAFKTLADAIDAATLGSLTRLINLLKELKGIYDDLVGRAQVAMESNARAKNTRESISTRYGADVLKQYDESNAANEALIAHRRRKNEIEAQGKNGRSKYGQTPEEFEFLARFDKEQELLAEKYRAAQDRFEKSAESMEKAIAQGKLQDSYRSANEQLEKQKQQWRDQQMAQDQRAMAPQIAQAQLAQQQAMGQQGDQAAADANLAAVQSGQYRGYFGSMTASQAADYFKSAPKAVADALKPDKEGNVNADQAGVVAQTYIAGLKQVGGLNQQAVAQLGDNLQQAIARIKNAPPALRDMLIDQLNQVDVKMHQIFNPNGPYAQQFAHSLGAALKQALGDSVKEVTDKANAAAATLGLRVEANFGNVGGPGQAFKGAARRQAEAGQARIKAQNDKLKQAMDLAANPQLAPAAQQAANAQVAKHQAELNRIVGEEQAKAMSGDAFAPGVMTRGTVGKQRSQMQDAVRAFNRAGSDNTAPIQREQSGALRQQADTVMAMIQRAMQFDGQAREQALASAMEARHAFDDMVNAAKRGINGLDDFKAATKKAADQAKALADAEKELTDDEIADMNARGVFTKQQQQQAQQQMQQAQQMIQQQVLGPLQQLMQQQAQATAQGAQALGTAALTGGGLDDLQDAIKNAKSPQEALGLVKSYLQAQAAQTLLNIKNVASTNDPILGSFGGQFQGANNLQYILSTGGNPLVDLYHDLLKQIDAIDAKLKSMPHMAAGGVVTGPTTALIGESGPEAVLPLGKFGQWFSSAMGAFGSAIGSVIGQIIPMGALQNAFGNPMGIFGNQGAFRINPGGFSVNPLGLNMGNLGAFDSMFGAASSILNRQADLGNTGALGILDQWAKVQQTAEDAIGFMRQHRRIDLGGHSGFGGRLSGYGESMYRNGYGSPFGSGFGGGGGHQFIMQMNVSGVMTQADISRAFDQFEVEARRHGADGLGRSRLRSGPYGQMTRGPLTPAGVPH